MVFVTGDTHMPTDIHKLAKKRWPEQMNLTRDDYLIVTGDFGGVWNGSREEQYWLKWLNQKPFTTLFVCGNHENFDMLNAYKVEEFHGGKVHKIMDNIYHLMRGQVFTIDGTKIFTMGGASSHDRAYRKEGKSWWKAEQPSEEEYQEAIDNLNFHEWNIDVVITHCAPDSVQSNLASWYEHDHLTSFLESVKQKISYQKWYFGHYHVDKKLDERHVAIYDIIERI